MRDTARDRLALIFRHNVSSASWRYFFLHSVSDDLRRTSKRPPIFIGGKARHAGVEGAHGRASMRPPIFIGGKEERADHHKRVLLASMRPPIFIGGKVDELARPAALGVASMRPPIFIGGKAVSTSPSNWTAASFNEAADLHRRKGPWAPLARPPATSGFNEAADLHRRKGGTTSRRGAA